jgi:hypothetical protein
MEAKDSTEVKNIGNSVLSLARGLGIRERALRRSRSIMELADKNEWSEARKEWDGVLSDLETGMIELKSAQLSQLGKSWRMVARYRGSIRTGTSELFTRAFQSYSPTGAD